MLRALSLGLLLSVALLGCGGGETDTGGDSTSTSTSTTTTTVAGHSLEMDVTLSGTGGQLSFLTPSNTVVQKAAADIVGKPYLFATFPAGFSPGNDPPIDYQWGQMPDSLTLAYVTPSTYEDGPYDIVFVCYTDTPIDMAMMDGITNAPPAKGGDLASFTLGTDQILPGDPKNALGTLRLNVAGADASVTVENRTPADPSQGTAAFTNTVLSIP
ncbi:MAG: hypothetical protein U0441_05900 [Polyangiaceae bacterium]